VNAPDENALAESREPREPVLVGFLCNWCSYAGADLAGTSRIPYTCSVRIVRVPCTARVDPLMVLRAFRDGADGVLVSGCHPGDCHYQVGNLHARRKLVALRELLTFAGIEPERFRVSWVSASEGRKWAEVVETVTRDLSAVGPSTFRDDGD
jgi:coenzyme F420-reducing hydrogenase delta subunit